MIRIIIILIIILIIIVIIIGFIDYKHLTLKPLVPTIVHGRNPDPKAKLLGSSN